MKDSFYERLDKLEKEYHDITNRENEEIKESIYVERDKTKK